MRKRKFALTEKEIKAFRQAEQNTRDAYELKRLQAVRLYGSGESMSNIQKVVNAADNTIRQWVMRYQGQGITGLASQWQGGNAHKLTLAQRADLMERIDSYTPDQILAPEVRIDQGSFWTVSDFQLVIEQWYGVVYKSQNAYYNLMRTCGLSYQKAEKVFRSQPSAMKLVEFEAELEKKVTDFLQDYPDGVLLAMDQMSLYFQATTTRVWAKRGQTPTIRVATQRDHVHFYGALNVKTGHEIALTLPKQTGALTCHFLDHLQACYPGRTLLILWDRAKWHKGEVVRTYLEQHPHLHTLHFPPGSPHLNPQEHVWERTRDVVSHNHTRKDFPALVNAFLQHLNHTLFQFQWLQPYAPSILFMV